MSVWPLPRITFRELSSIEEKRPVALLTSEEVWAVLSTQLSLPVLIQAEPANYDRDLFDYLAAHLPAQVKVVYAVGQGAPVAAGKLVAARNNIPLVVVPTALDSVELFDAQARVDAEIDGRLRVTYEEVTPPTEVIVDWGVVQAAPETTRAAGIVDVLSIVTGLLDWRHAAQKGRNPRSQRFVPWAAGVVTGLAKQAIKSAAAVGQGSLDDLETLLHLMLTTVHISNQLGHRRIYEGGAHYLAQILATQGNSALSHAERVGPCLLFVSALHNQPPDPLRTALESAGVALDRLNPTDVQLVLRKLPAFLEAYEFPYSILNDLDPESEAVSAALEAAGLDVEPETWEVPSEPETWEDSSPAEDVPGEAPHGTKEAGIDLGA